MMLGGVNTISLQLTHISWEAKCKICQVAAHVYQIKCLLILGHKYKKNPFQFQLSR